MDCGICVNHIVGVRPSGTVYAKPVSHSWLADSYKRQTDQIVQTNYRNEFRCLWFVAEIPKLFFEYDWCVFKERRGSFS